MAGLKQPAGHKTQCSPSSVCGDVWFILFALITDAPQVRLL